MAKLSKKILFIAFSSLFFVNSSFANSELLDLRVYGSHAGNNSVIQNNSVLFTGDSFSAKIIPSVDLHTYAFHVDTLGNVTSLRSSDSIDSSGEAIFLPGGKSEYFLSGNTGVETLIVIGSLDKYKISELEKAINNQNLATLSNKRTVVYVVNIKHEDPSILTRAIDISNLDIKKIKFDIDKSKEIKITDLPKDIRDSILFNVLNLDNKIDDKLTNKFIQIASTPAGKTRGQKEAAMYKKVSQSVIKVRRSDGGGGSGFVINKEGEIITNHHVVHKEGETIKNGVVLNGTIFVDIAFKPKRGSKRLVWYKARVLKVSASSDLALLKLIDKPDNLRPIEFSKNDDIEVGHDSYAIGHPGGHSNWSLTPGAISQLRFDEYWGYGDGVGRRGAKMIIQSTSSIFGGNSGGPLVDENGKLIGVNSFSPTLTVNAKPLSKDNKVLDVEGYSALNFAVSVDDVLDFIKQKSSTDVKKGQFYINKFGSEFEGKIVIGKGDSDYETISILVDSNNNGFYEMQVYRDLNKDKNLHIDIFEDKEGGEFVERREDANENGIIDLYLYHNGKKWITKGYDDDEDGKIDRWEKM